MIPLYHAQTALLLGVHRQWEQLGVSKMAWDTDSAEVLRPVDFSVSFTANAAKK
jgi:hypothetical protein